MDDINKSNNKSPLVFPPKPYKQDITETILELRHLSAALTAFHRRYDDLLSHLHFISSSIDSLPQNPNSQIPITYQTLTKKSNSAKTLIADKSKDPESSSTKKPLNSKTTIPISIPDQPLVSEKTQICPPQENPVLEKTTSSNPGKTLISEKYPIFIPGRSLIPQDPQIFSTKKFLNSKKDLISEQTPIPILDQKPPVSEKPTLSNPGKAPICHPGKTPISEQSSVSHPEKPLISKDPQIASTKTILSVKKELISEQSPISETGKTLSLKDPQMPSTEKTHNSVKGLISEQTSILSPEKSLNLEQSGIAHSEKTQNLEESEIVSLCKSMEGNRLRKYLLSHLSEPEKFLEEVPLALKQCPNPSKLLLDCIGQFYRWTTNAYQKNPSLNRSRMVAIIMLEFFLMMEFDVGEGEEKDFVETALKWKTRMTDEGGIEKASEIDAKGLLLFIGCSGIPNEFSDDDVLDLVRVSNAKDISGLLHKSEILIKRMKEIIEAKQKKKNDVEALDIAFTFHLKSRYSPGSILDAFLRSSKKSWDVAKKLVQDLKPNQAILLFKRQLADLKTLVKCFDKHKVDPSGLIPNWHPKKRIGQIERELSHLEKDPGGNSEKIVQTKRKADQPALSKRARKRKRKEAHLDQGHEQEKAVGDLKISIENKSSPVLSRPYQIDDALINERFANRGLPKPERYASPSYIGSERLVSPSYNGPERLVRPRVIGSEKSVSPSYFGPERYVAQRGYGDPIMLAANGVLRPSLLGPFSIADPYVRDYSPMPPGISSIGPFSIADPYVRDYNPMPPGISSNFLPGESSKADLYGFADAF